MSIALNAAAHCTTVSFELSGLCALLDSQKEMAVVLYGLRQEAAIKLAIVGSAAGFALVGPIYRSDYRHILTARSPDSKPRDAHFSAISNKTVRFSAVISFDERDSLKIEHGCRRRWRYFTIRIPQESIPTAAVDWEIVS